MADPDDVDRLVPLLKQVGLFSRCSDYDLRLIARKAELREVPRGSRIISEGDLGSDLFLVLLGGAEVAVDGDLQVSFGPGDHFGELSALLPAPRTSDVTATDRTLLAVFSTDQVYSLLEVVPGAARKMLEGLAGSLREKITSH